jgi:3-hydroxyacyl-CoA dehydrogenase
MKLLEVVRGSRTSAETMAVSFALAKRLGKIPVVAGVCDGFIGNRILARDRHMADMLLIEGALPDEVDGAMREFGMAMGPYEAQDLSGLDIGHANRVRQKLRQRSDIRYIPVADRMVEELARLGRKSGAGWYDYADTGKPIVSAVVSELIRQSSHEASIARRSFTSNEIVERIVLAMTVEALAILQQDIAERPADIDLVMVHGYGFPRWRGGLMHYASALPPDEMIARISELAAEDPLSWSVPPLLRRLADQGRSIACLNDA